MKVTLLQHDIAWGDTFANLRHIEEMMPSSTGTQLLLLPEMFSTGFVMDPQRYAAPDERTALHWMQHTSRRLQAAVVGSVATHTEGRYYNRCYFVQPDGRIDYYDKRHLFSYAGEDEAYSAGHRRVVVRYGGMRFLLQVCYDLRFPVFSRYQDDYDALLFVANWPHSRIAAWRALLKARAIENQCYVLAVNRVGTAGRLTYSGSSMVVHPDGHIVACAEDYAEEAVMAEIDPDTVCAFREDFPFLHDRDAFSIDQCEK